MKATLPSVVSESAARPLPIGDKQKVTCVTTR